MDRVFHFSDFHITPSLGDPKTNEAFSLLLDSLQPYSEGTNYIVYTGDVIDALYINRQPETKRVEAEKECYTLAIKYFKELQIKLGVRSDRLVFCLGNHDIRRGAIAGAKDLCDPDILHDECKYRDGFAGFCAFHKELLDRDFDYGAHLYEINDFRFFVANSVWREKNDPGDVKSSSGRIKEYPRCISCVNLLKTLEDNIATLEQDSTHGKNIFLIHDPSIAWCENANLEYNREAVREQIELLFSYRLCGDKHTRGFVDNFHIVGNRLSGGKNSYGFIEYSTTNGEYKQVLLDNKQKRWFVLQNREVITKVVRFSQPYLKPIALSLASDTSHNLSCDEDQIISSAKKISKAIKENDERWKNLNLLFEKIASYQIPSDGPGEKIVLDGNIIKQIADDIVSTIGGPFRLFVRGKPSRGKSVFLSLEYLYFLSLFQEGLFPFVPALFNCESLIECANREKAISQVNTYFDTVKAFSKEIGMPVCFILDGFLEYKHYGINIEDLVYNEYLSGIDINPQITDGNIFIISIDMEDKSSLAATTISEIRKANRLLYFSEIETEGLRIKQAEELVNLFCKTVKTVHSHNPGIIMQNISRLRVPAVDLNLLFHHGNALSDQTDPPTICRLYQKYFLATIVDPEQRVAAKKHAYGVWFLSKRYAASALDNMSLRTYNCLLREKTLTYYLTALHYCEEIVSYSKDSKRQIEKNSVLNHFFNQEQNRILNAVFSDQKIQKEEILEFIEYHYNSLQSSGRSQFIYLISMVDELSDVNVDKKARSSNTAPSMDSRELFYAKVANRTIELMETRKDRSKMEAYIEMHISNPEQRSLNRAVHMLYYADINESEAFEIESVYKNTIFAGFDIYHSFFTLLGRAKKSLSVSVNRLSDWLVFLDVFTLCDFIQERLRTPTAKTHAKHSIDEKVVESFFYTKKYNTSTISPMGVLQEMSSLVRKVVEKLKSLNHDVLNDYFSQCLLDFKKCLELYNTGYDCLSASMFHASQAFNSICKLSSVDRSGWKIPECLPNPAEKELSKEETKEISEKLTQYLRRESLESVMIHTFEMYYLGLLYLPEKKPDEDGFEEYNKQTILNMVLIHDIGECETGDVPYYDPKHNVKKKKEDDFNRKMFIGGAFSGFADLTQSLNLWKEWMGHSSINSIIAHELDTIQLLYKYYCLKKESQLTDFSPERRQELEEERFKITTTIGQNILNTIVYSNPEFLES